MTPSQIDRLNTALAGRYRIERELGEGGMATVYLWEDIKHERNVALKLPSDLPQRLIRDVMSGKTHVIRTIDRPGGSSIGIHSPVCATQSPALDLAAAVVMMMRDRS